VPEETENKLPPLALPAIATAPPRETADLFTPPPEDLGSALTALLQKLAHGGWTCTDT
jgi:hypothetical protein